MGKRFVLRDVFIQIKPVENKPHVHPSTAPRKTEGVQTVILNGKTFQTTATFDMFWRYAFKRHSIEEKRRAGEPQPWTNDRILQKMKFTSIFRVADRGSQFLVREVIERGSQKPEDVVFRVLLYDTFTRIETYQLLERRLGPLTWSTYNREKYAKVLQDAMSKEVKVYTGAFQKPAPALGYKNAFQNHLSLLEIMMGRRIHEELARCKYMADAFDMLYRYPGLGDFMAFQLLMNLSYTSLLPFGENDFIVAGVGARKGLRKCFKPVSSIAGCESELIRWMMETQTEHFTRMGLPTPRLGKELRLMTLVDVEHTLCELFKYARYVSRGAAVVGKPYAPRTCLPRYPTLPRAWSQPERALVRPRPGKYVRPEKHYVVSHIVAHGLDDRGELLFLVDWLGYDARARTWEPAKRLREDAGPLVEEYEMEHGLSRRR